MDMSLKDQAAWLLWCGHLVFVNISECVLNPFDFKGLPQVFVNLQT